MTIRRINNRLLCFLIAAIVLMNASHEESHALNAHEAARDLIKVLAETPAPGMIGETIGAKIPPVIRPWPEGQTKIIQRHDFNFHDKNMSYTFYIDDNKIVRMGSDKRFYLQRGIKYEELEKLYITALTKYFGSRPAKSSVESTFGGSRKSFVWIVRNNNLNARIELFVIYDRRSLAPNSITRFLWRKREQISVSIFVENQYISNYTVSK